MAEPEPGQFYLFRTQRYGREAITRVYYSTDPMDFGINRDEGHLIASLPVAAPEVFQEDHQWFIGALLPSLKGIQMARLEWARTPLNVPVETVEQSRQRHQQVAERRQGVHVICHRGASEFAHENTLEAYRATFELGGDGNEIDIRSTKDGVLVCFHDDMLDRLLQGQGDVSELTSEELRQLPFREPGTFGEHCRIPTLVEVLELHRKHGGLMHLDIKRPGLDQAIADLLERMDMWDHVAYCNSENSGQHRERSTPEAAPLQRPLVCTKTAVRCFPDVIASA